MNVCCISNWMNSLFIYLFVFNEHQGLCIFLQYRIITLKKIHLQTTVALQLRLSNLHTVPVLKNKPTVLSRYQQRRCCQLHWVSAAPSASAWARLLKPMMLPVVLHMVLQSPCQTEVSLQSAYQITFCMKICRMLLGLLSGCVKSSNHYTLPVCPRHHVNTLCSFCFSCSKCSAMDNVHLLSLLCHIFFI